MLSLQSFFWPLYLLNSRFLTTAWWNLWTRLSRQVEHELDYFYGTFLAPSSNWREKNGSLKGLLSHKSYLITSPILPKSKATDKSVCRPVARNSQALRPCFVATSQSPHDLVVRVQEVVCDFNMAHLSPMILVFSLISPRQGGPRRPVRELIATISRWLQELILLLQVFKFCPVGYPVPTLIKCSFEMDYWLSRRLCITFCKGCSSSIWSRHKSNLGIVQ